MPVPVRSVQAFILLLDRPVVACTLAVRARLVAEIQRSVVLHDLQHLGAPGRAQPRAARDLFGAVRAFINRADDVTSPTPRAGRSHFLDTRDVFVVEPVSSVE